MRRTKKARTIVAAAPGGLWLWQVSPQGNGYELQALRPATRAESARALPSPVPEPGSRGEETARWCVALAPRGAK